MNDIIERIMYKSEKVSWEDILKYKDNSDDEEDEYLEKINEREEDMNYLIIKMFMMTICNMKMMENLVM